MSFASHQIHLIKQHHIQLTTPLAHLLAHVIKDTTEHRTPRGLTREQANVLEGLTSVLLNLTDGE
mgnify:CR=1 FL=1